MEGTGPCAKQWRRARGAVPQQGSGGMSSTAECVPAHAHEQAVQAVETLQHIKGEMGLCVTGHSMCVRMCVCVGAQALPCQRLTLGVGPQCSPGGWHCLLCRVNQRSRHRGSHKHCPHTVQHTHGIGSACRPCCVTWWPWVRVPLCELVSGMGALVTGGVVSGVLPHVDCHHGPLMGGV